MKRAPRSLTLLLCGSLLMACAAIGVAQEDKGASPKMTQRLNRAPVNHDVLQVKLPRPTEVKLPNGLTVLLLEHHKVPRVHFNLWISSGSLDDPAELPGLAKFTAEMLREGTTQRTSSQISSAVDELGGELESGLEAGSTHTAIGISGFSEDSDKLLALLTDVVMNPSFPSEELEKYKKRQLADLEQERSDPGFLSQERLYRALYGSHPASQVSATPASVKAVTPEQLKLFHQAHYLPNNAMLGVVGDFDSKQMQALIQKHFGGWKQQAFSAISHSNVPAAPPFRIALIDRPDSVQTDILAGALTVPRNNPDFLPLRVLNRVLGEGSSGRLFLNLREDKGYTYGAYSSFATDTYPRPLIANTEVRTAVTDGSMHELLGELKRLREEPVPAAELDAAGRAIVASFALSLEHPTELLYLWMEVKHDQLPEDYWDKYPAELAKVTPAQVQQAAKKYLDPNRLQVVCVGNGKEIKDVLAKYGPVDVYDVDGKKVESTR